MTDSHFRGLGGRPPRTPSHSGNRPRGPRPSRNPVQVTVAVNALRHRVLAGEPFYDAALAVAREFNVAYDALVAAY